MIIFNVYIKSTRTVDVYNGDFWAQFQTLFGATKGTWESLEGVPRTTFAIAA